MVPPITLCLSTPHQTYYPIKEKETSGRTIDAAEERVRRVFNQLGNHAKTAKSQFSWGQPDFIVTPITFRQGQYALDSPAKDFLIKLTTDLQESGNEKLKLYVVGLASQEPEGSNNGCYQPNELMWSRISSAIICRPTANGPYIHGVQAPAATG